MTGTSREKPDKKFTSLKVGNNVTINGKTTTIDKDVTAIGDKAFYKCNRNLIYKNVKVLKYK